MRHSIRFIVGIVFLACGTHTVGFGHDASATFNDATQSSLPRCVDSKGYTIDGRFTGFNGSSGAQSTTTTPPYDYEWATVQNIAGMYTYMYMDGCSDTDGDHLYFLNDWYKNDVAPVAAQCFNRFDFFDVASQDAIEVRTYGDGKITIFKNGVDVTADAKAGAAFTSSPNVSKGHSIFEFSMMLPYSPAVQQSQWTMGASDPCGGAPPPPPPPPPNPPAIHEVECEDPSYLIDEPVMALVTFGSPSNVTTQVAPTTPIVMALDHFDAAPGDTVVARGRHLGTTPGTVTIGAVSATIHAWTDNRIAFVVPDGVPPNAPTQIVGDGWSVAGPRVTGPSHTF